MVRGSTKGARPHSGDNPGAGHLPLCHPRVRWGEASLSRLCQDGTGQDMPRPERRGQGYFPCRGALSRINSLQLEFDLGERKARMARKKTADDGAALGFEEKLWLAADKLRGSMDVAEDKHVVLGLVFLKYI